MQLYKTTIKAESNFVTPLKGDTLFGQLCWSIKYLYGKKKLEELLQSYKENSPFLVVSDSFANGYLPKPKMPSKYLNEDPQNKKQNRKKIWILLEDLQNGVYANAKTDKEVKNEDENILSIHNAINYKTFHTGDGFDPYGIEESTFLYKDIYFLLDEKQMSLEELKNVLTLTSQIGYGKYSTTGKGRFSHTNFENITLKHNSNTYMTLSPLFAKEIKKKIFYYEPFVRFGKFGGKRAYKNAFKKPIILADSASVISFEDKLNDLFIGNPITNFSDTHSDAVHQGYSIVIPIKEITHANI